MYCITDEQIEYILNDIKQNGVETEDLQLNLLDHICCIIEQELADADDFERVYRNTVKQFYKRDLREIEEETAYLLTNRNYYKMKKIMILSGALSAATFIAGSFMKIMHWQGASLLLIVGILSLSLIFLPLVVALKTRDQASVRDKVVLGLAALTGILYALATLFAAMRWPGHTTLWFATVSLSTFVLIPVYFFTGIRKPEARVNTIVTSILLLGATGLLFTMIDTRPDLRLQARMYTYMQNERILKNMQRRSATIITTDTASARLAVEINTTCEEIKGNILRLVIGQRTVPANWQERKVVIEEDRADVFYNPAELKLLAKLQLGVQAYNATQQDEDNKIPADLAVLDTDHGKIGAYTSLAVLASITQLQMYVASAAQSALATK